MVFQQFALLPWRTAIDNVALGLGLVGVPAAERRRRAAKLLELVKLCARLSAIDGARKNAHKINYAKQE